jgi:hypothetical protein
MRLIQFLLGQPGLHITTCATMLTTDDRAPSTGRKLRREICATATEITANVEKKTSPLAVRLHGAVRGVAYSNLRPPRIPRSGDAEEAHLRRRGRTVLEGYDSPEIHASLRWDDPSPLHPLRGAARTLAATTVSPLTAAVKTSCRGRLARG